MDKRPVGDPGGKATASAVAGSRFAAEWRGSVWYLVGRPARAATLTLPRWRGRRQGCLCLGSIHSPCLASEAHSQEARLRIGPVLGHDGRSAVSPVAALLGLVAARLRRRLPGLRPFDPSLVGRAPRACLPDRGTRTAR